MTTNAPQLGKVINQDETAFRDAIHVAVAPLVAGTDLVPGQKFILVNGDAFPAAEEVDGLSSAVGVVDPFLNSTGVKKGQKFWGLIVPGTITSLRHAWGHPAFTAKVPQKKD